MHLTGLLDTCFIPLLIRIDLGTLSQNWTNQVHPHGFAYYYNELYTNTIIYEMLTNILICIFKFDDSEFLL